MKKLISIISIIFIFIGCSNNKQNNETSNLINDSTSNSDSTTSLEQNIAPISNENDTMSFESLLKMNKENKLINNELIRKYLISDFPENNPEIGRTYSIDIKEVYKIDSIVAIVFWYVLEEPGRMIFDDYLNTYQNNGIKIDSKRLKSQTTTEWNTIEISYNLRRKNQIIRLCYETEYSVEEQGTKISKQDTTKDIIKIGEEGRIK